MTGKAAPVRRRSSKRAAPARDARSSEDAAGPLAELARRAQSGERSALEQFAIATRRYVTLAIRTRMTKELRREVEVDEIANTAWVSIQHSLAHVKVRGERSLVGWLRRVAVSRLLDAIKFFRRESRSAHATEPIDALLEHPDALAPEALHATDDHVRDFWQRVDVTEVVAALKQLPPELGEVLWRVDFEQRSVRDAARRAGISESVARQRHAMARIRLASLLRPR